ncbi:MAG: efflux RND transporter periplasmic adaptor subunit [Nitrosomonadales bacterium]|nr:efflux RND transporter periplasmic adaptor subunit [Nitrosomonadales bacterium]
MKQSILLVAIAVALTACGKEAPPPAKAERPAMTHVVGTQAGDAGHVYSGEVRARHESTLGFRIGGKLVERLVDAGAQVKAGQVLARLDASDAGLQAGAATAQFRLAEAEIKRYRELRARGFVSQAALDAKEAAFEAASAQAGLARNQSAYTTLRADHDGIVAATFAEAGQVVAAGQPVVRVARHGAREVALAVPEAHFNEIRAGAPVEVTLAGDGSAPLAGKVREITPMADAASRTYPVRVALADTDAQVALGMTARVRFSGSDNREGFLIPLTALFQQGDGTAVWIVAADRSISLRPVRVSAYRDDGALITGGLAAGERIVSAGVHKLAAGEKIRILESAQ